MEAHGGRLWTTANVPHGATFHFALAVNVDTEVGDLSETAILAGQSRFTV
jgi:hypothetical protein